MPCLGGKDLTAMFKSDVYFVLCIVNHFTLGITGHFIYRDYAVS